MPGLPAEWEDQSFLQISFPHIKSDWKPTLPQVIPCFVDIISTAARFQDVLVISDNVREVKSHFKQTDNIFFTQIETNDTWVRDYGGITVLDNEKPIIYDFIFNGWENKYPARKDNLVTKQLFDKRNY